MFPRPPVWSWLDDLSDEDVAFLKRLVLASGSLKGLAAAYGVSYPTIRLRLDRLIEKIEVMDKARDATAFERTLLGCYADGKVDAATVKSLLAAHQQDLSNRPAGTAGAAKANG